MLRSPRFLLLAVVSFAALAFFFARPYHHIPSVTHPVLSDTAESDQPANGLLTGKPPAGSSDDARNATLGFEKVFVINLPERYDKLDAFSIAASLTGFTHEVMEGIKGSTVVNKTLPTLDNVPEVPNTSLHHRTGTDFGRRTQERGTTLWAAGVPT
ncbi:MAG: hypothetical protein Q9179_003356 [Wetmoreana sp. 5 TL-2023]